MNNEKEQKKRPAMHVIANETGVSVATVWRVLNGRDDVKAETRDSVLSYLKKHGYETQLATPEPKLIGIVDTFQRHSLSSYYLSSIIEGADAYIHSHGYTTTLLHSDAIERDIREYGHAATLRSLSGLLWMEPVYSKAYRDIVSEHGIPCVVINNCEPDVEANVIESDNHAAARLATQFLLGHGHRDIAFMGGWLQLTNHADRYRGFVEALEEAGVELPKELVVDDLTLWNDEGGREGIHRLLSSRKKPTAVVVCSDFLVNGAYAAIKEMGFSIPEDISVISFDDFPMASYMDPPLTACRQPLKQMGTMAAERLIQIIDRPHLTNVTERTYVRMPFIVRNSTRSIT